MTKNVRNAELTDITSMLYLLNVMQMESGKNNVDWFKVAHVVVDCIRQRLVMVYTTDEGVIIGSIGGAVTSEWYSEESLLGDYWFFVHPDYRVSPAAFQLMKAWKELGNSANLTVKAGHTLGDKLEEKDNLFTKLGFKKTGSLFERVPDGRSVSSDS